MNGPPRNATVAASFADTTFYKGSTVTSPLAVTKNAATTTLAQPGAVVFGEATSFNATVAAANGTSTPTGTVQFTVNGSDFGAPVPVSGGAASLGGIDSLAAGSHTVGAVYSGDANFAGSNAATKQQVVDKAPTSTVLTSTGSPTVSGETVTFTATVDIVAPGAGTLSGGVQFNVDGVPFGTSVPLTGNTAELAISNLSAGNHQVSATYNGTTNFAPEQLGRGDPRGQPGGHDAPVWARPTPTPWPGSPSPSPLTSPSSRPVRALRPATSSSSWTAAPLGGPVALVNGSATSPTANLNAGDHVISADYQGDARTRAPPPTSTRRSTRRRPPRP